MNETKHVVEGEVIDAKNVCVEKPTGRAALPMLARVPIVVRWATLDDVPFIDSLQKKTNREVGFLPTKAIEGKIKLRQCAIAEVASCELRVASGETGKPGYGTGGVPTVAPDSDSVLATTNSQLATIPVGYIIAADRYSKRDEVGCIVQVNVHPDYRRSLVAAQLLQFQYDHSAYGCKLYSCWCAQDLAANEFWEAMGYVPIAFRTGARNKVKKADGTKGARIHIFWQRRIRPGDKTPYWYPSQTGGGELCEDRLVFPIMAGVSWRDVMPVVLPEDCTVDRLKAIEDQTEVGVREDNESEKSQTPNAESRTPKKSVAKTEAVKTMPTMHRRIGSGFWYQREKEEILAKHKPAKKHGRGTDRGTGNTRAKKEKVEKKSVAIDPRLLQAARELRDRWQEEAHLLDESHRLAQSKMKYDVVRVESNSTMIEGKQKELMKLVA